MTEWQIFCEVMGFYFGLWLVGILIALAWDRCLGLILILGYLCVLTTNLL